MQLVRETAARVTPPRYATGSSHERPACHDGRMSTGRHYDHPLRPCWHCVYWAGACWGDAYMAGCRYGGAKACVADASNGCVHWIRETGVDDDGWQPAPLERPKATGKPAFKMTPVLNAVVKQIQSELDRR